MEIWILRILLVLNLGYAVWKTLTLKRLWYQIKDPQFRFSKMILDGKPYSESETQHYVDVIARKFRAWMIFSLVAAVLLLKNL